MNFQKIIDFVYKKHAGQVDKAGNPYIIHPIVVALNMNTDEEKVVALLHDVIEDTDATISDLKELELSDEIIDAVKILTHNPDVPYMDYIKSIATNSIARKVKLEDLKHNMDLSRGEVTESILSLQKRYNKAYKYLMEVEKNEKNFSCCRHAE